MSDARIMKFQTAKAFYDFCVKHDACEEGLAEISGLTLDEWEIRHPNGKAGYNPDGGLTIADWWDKTERADWMLWLRDQDVWNFPVPSNAKWRAECVLIIDTEWLAWRASDAEWLAWRASHSASLARHASHSVSMISTHSAGRFALLGTGKFHTS